MKVLLVGNGSRLNRGCEAITISTVELLQEAFPNVEIEIYTWNKEADNYYKKLFETKIEDIENEDYSKANIALRILNRFIQLPDYYQKKHNVWAPYIKGLMDCDLVLSLGGDNYTDDYGLAHIFWNLSSLAKKNNRLFIIWGASIGPFKSEENLKLAQRELKKVPLITARENRTIKYLEEIGYNGRIVRVYDTAFILKTKETEVPIFSRNAELVGFNISPIYYKYTSKTSEEILEITCNFLKGISKEYNILLIPHVFEEKKMNNDFDYMGHIANEIENCILASPHLNSMQLKYLISQCDYFIGARTHSTIAAFSSMVPTLSLGYSTKARGLNEELFGTDNFLLEADNFGIENLNSKFQYVVKNREKAKRLLVEKRSLFDEMARKGLVELKKLINVRLRSQSVSMNT